MNKLNMASLWNTSNLCYAATGPGFPLSNTISIAPGFYSPNLPINSTDISQAAVYCTPSMKCGIDRLGGKACERQGRYEPTLCLSGTYCSDWATQLPCPEGYFCPSGTSTPYVCDWLASCPTGSRAQTPYIGIFLCVIIDVLVVVLVLLNQVNKLRSQKLPWYTLLGPQAMKWMGLEVVKMEEPGKIFARDSAVSPDASIGSHPQSVDADKLDSLVNNYKRALGGVNICMNFLFEDMSLTLRDGKRILQGVSGDIHSGTMTAIMGPSGAGKTTFLHVLCGKVSRTSGKLLVSGKETEIHKYKKLVGYVPQEDIMHRELTVYENIIHSAKVRLPTSWTDKQVKDYVEDILYLLKLSHIRDTPIGDEYSRGVSGGQRKRVNIAMELAAAPVSLFLDEPTTGLDSTSALEVCDVLRHIADLGLSVVSVIHQPRIEIFRKFDHVLLLVTGGKTAYMGPTLYTVEYFERLGYVFDKDSNAADVLMDILAGKACGNKSPLSPEQLAEHWIKEGGVIKSMSLKLMLAKPEEEASLSNNESTFPATSDRLVAERGASWWRQILLCHNRSLAQQIATFSNFATEIGVGALAGVVMGVSVMGAEQYHGIYNPPYTLISQAPLEFLVPMYGLLLGIAIALTASSSGVALFGPEKAVYWREAGSGHSALGYYLGKTFASFYRIALSSLHFTAIYVIIAKPIIQFSIQYTIILLLFTGVYGLASIVSVVASRGNTSMVASIVCLIAAILCGFGPNLGSARSWGILFLWEISFNKWAAEALYNESINFFSSIYMVDVSAKIWGYSLGRTSFDIGMGFMLCAVYRVVAFFLMILLNRDKQR